MGGQRTSLKSHGGAPDQGAEGVQRELPDEGRTITDEELELERILRANLCARFRKPDEGTQPVDEASHELLSCIIESLANAPSELTYLARPDRARAALALLDPSKPPLERMRLAVACLDDKSGVAPTVTMPERL